MDNGHFDTLYTDTNMKSISHLPDPNNSIGNEDQKNNNRLYKGGGRFFSLFKQSQDLEKHIDQIMLANKFLQLSRKFTIKC